jgi:multiple sugar transport system substrate-binding protein
MRLQSVLLLWLLIAIVPVHARASSGTPLRIWVMHNELGSHTEPATPERIQAFVESWREESGIEIENSLQNLLAPSELDHPFADYIIGNPSILTALADFRRSHPEVGPIAIEFLRWNDAFNRLTDALAARDISRIPDVVQIGSTWLASFADRGLFADISGRFDPSAFFPPSVASSRIAGDDRFFAIPWFIDTRLLFFNRAAASEEAFRDWRSFSDACAAFKQATGRAFIAFNNAVTWNLLHDLAPWIWAAGGDILEPAAGSVTAYRISLDTPASEEGLSYLKSLSAARCADFPEFNREAMEKRFLNGDYAAIITGPWLVKKLGPNWQERYGITMPPAGPAGATTFVGGSHLAISARSRERGTFEEAVALVNYLASPAPQMAFATGTSLIPAQREALREFIDTTGITALRDALELGRSYPSIPEWGTIVENDLIRTQFWHLWREIAQNVPDEVLRAKAAGAASELRSKIRVAIAQRYGKAMALAAGFLSLLGTGFLTAKSRRHRRALLRAEQKSQELARLTAERALLEGKLLLLERRHDEDSGEFEKLRREYARLEVKTSDLNLDLAKARESQRRQDRKRIGDFCIRSDGSLSIEGAEIHFENYRQARRLIEHLVRQSCGGTASVHCLWGYPLFGWEADKIQSPPQRLFDTMVSKINGALKSAGAPPLLKRVGRNTCAWTFAWEREAVLAGSDIRRAMEEAAAAAASQGDVAEASLHAIASAELDPKNLEALDLAARLLAEGGAGLETHRVRLAASLKIGERLWRQELAAMTRGAAAISRMLAAGSFPGGLDAETAKDQCALIAQEVAHLAHRTAVLLGGGRSGARPLLFDEISHQLLAIQHEIAELKATGIAEAHLWASIVDSQPFTRLLAIPNVRTLVHNVYNRETQAREDPRLVQLALIWLLSEPGVREALGSAASEQDLLAVLDRGVRRKLVALERELDPLTLM